MNIVRRLVAASLVAALVLNTVAASAAYEAFISIKGHKQGQLKGSVTRTGHVGAFQVLSVGYKAETPRDASSGMATGRRESKPVIVMMEPSAATPALLQILATNEVLDTVQLEVVKPATQPGTAETPVAKLVLSNATGKVERVKVTRPGGGAFDERLKISFSFESITFENGSKSAPDDWNTAG